MDDEYAKPRDVDTDLAEITSRLGEPETAHRTNTLSVAWRLVLGVLIVLAAAGLHYVMWTGQVPWPRGRAWKLWIILLVSMFVGPGVGLYLIGFAVRGLKLWVLTYPTGLFVWHRGRVVGVPWDEVMSVQIAGLPDKASLNRSGGSDGLPETVWFDLDRSRRRVFGTTITLTRADAEQVVMTSTLDDFANLGRRVQEETYRRLFPVARQELRSGRPVTFGPVECDREGITIGKQMLPWGEVESVERVADKLEVKRTGKKKKTFAKCDLNDVVNLHVLMGLIAIVRALDAANEEHEAHGERGT